MKQKYGIFTFKNGVVIRTKNKRLSILDSEIDGVKCYQFVGVRIIEANEKIQADLLGELQTCTCKLYRSKLLVTTITYTAELFF